MRSWIRDIVIFVLAYKIIKMTIAGAAGIDVAVLAIAAALISLWFILEKLDIL